jgi:hypothetical protein
VADDGRKRKLQAKRLRDAAAANPFANTNNTNNKAAAPAAVGAVPGGAPAAVGAAVGAAPAAAPSPAAQPSAHAGSPAPAAPAPAAPAPAGAPHHAPVRSDGKKRAPATSSTTAGTAKFGATKRKGRGGVSNGASEAGVVLKEMARREARAQAAARRATRAAIQAAASAARSRAEVESPPTHTPCPGSV